MGAVKPQHIPNLITVFRILLVIPVVRSMMAGRFDLALALFLLAGLSDAVDGFLAKYFGWQSRLGSFLDPIADKLLLVSCFVTAGILDLIPTWLVVAVVLRDLVIVLGATAYHFLLGPFEGKPLLTSKLNTLVQLVLIVLVLIDRGIKPVYSLWLDMLIVGTLLTTVLSGAMYVYLWGQRYSQATRGT